MLPFQVCITGSALRGCRVSSFRIRAQECGALWGLEQCENSVTPLKLVDSKKRGDINSQRYFQPSLPINQILLKIWKLPNCSILISFYCKLQVSLVLRVSYNRSLSQFEVSWCQPHLNDNWSAHLVRWAFLLCQCQPYRETASASLLLRNIPLKAVMHLTKAGLRGNSCTFLLARWNGERLAWCLTSETYPFAGADSRWPHSL